MTTIPCHHEAISEQVDDALYDMRFGGARFLRGAGAFAGGLILAGCLTLIIGGIFVVRDAADWLRGLEGRA